MSGGNQKNYGYIPVIVWIASELDLPLGTKLLPTAFMFWGIFSVFLIIGNWVHA